MSNIIQNGASTTVNLQTGEKLAVSAIDGTFSAVIRAGVGVGTALATNALGGEYGPYAGPVVIQISSSADGLVDFEVGAVPTLDYREPVTATTNPLTGGSVFSGGGAALKVGASMRNKNAFALLGDSRMAQYQVDAPAIVGAIGNWKNSVHFLAHANAQLGQRINVVYSGAVSGNRSDQYLAHLDGAIASPAKRLIIWGSVNDIAYGCTASQVWTGVGMPTASIGIQAAAIKAINAGMDVILVGDPGQVGLSSAKMGYVQQYNQFCREFCESFPNAYYFDAPSVVLDQTQTSVAFKTGYSADGTHTLAIGAYNLGVSFASFISPLVTAFGQQPNAAWDVGANGGTNLLINPLFLSTTGGTAGASTTGPIPNTWEVSGSAQVSVVVSTAAGVCGNDLVLTLTASAAGTAQLFHYQNPPGNGANYGAPVAGDIHQVGVEYTVDAGSSRFCPPAVRELLQLDGINFQPGDMYSGAANGPGPTTAYTNVLQSPKFVIPAFTTCNQWGWYLNIAFDAAGSAVLRVRRPKLTKRFS